MCGLEINSDKNSLPYLKIHKPPAHLPPQINSKPLSILEFGGDPYIPPIINKPLLHYSKKTSIRFETISKLSYTINIF